MSNAQNLKKALEPKSDQLNADDLITESKTIKITKVSVNIASQAQKIVIYFDGDNGKPWKPSKGMGRVMAQIWGGDPDLWIGEQATLYRNSDVIYAGEKVGGIQISHMTKISSRMTILITTAKGKRSSIVIDPIKFSDAIKTENAQNTETKNPELRALAEKLQVASRLGVESFEKELFAAPQNLRSEMRDWIIKCAANAAKVDDEKFVIGNV
jgi:hypothetical protein